MMQSHTLCASDGIDVHYYAWVPAQVKGVVQLAHGMGEHAQRYDRVGRALAEAGFAVYANDHRGHGATADRHLGYMGADGWNRVLADAYELNCHYRSLHPQAPLVLLGHSMGSMMSQQYITRYGRSIDGLVLSGSPGFKKPLLSLLPLLIARFERWRLGDGQSSDVLQKLLFGDANKPFDAPAASGFEWLSRDAQEVQRYVDDELCGFVLSTASLVDLFVGARAAQTPAALAKIPGQLPIYVFSGSDDPVHSEQQDLNRLLAAYREQGLNVESRIYPAGRHEMFNETNRDEVVADLIAALNNMIG